MFQTIRSFQALSVADAATTSPQDEFGMGTFPTYTDAVSNSVCDDTSYMCAGAAVTKAAGDFYSYSMN